MPAKPKIGALIPARSTSQRLPRKQLADLCGAPVVVRMIERLACSRHLASTAAVVVCTTEEPSDDDLAETARAAGATVFRGDADDLIARLADATAEHRLDVVIEADGDDPFIDVGYADAAVDLLLADDALDVVTLPELPLGLATKIVRGAAFERVRASYRTRRNDTGFMYFFTRSGLCTVAQLDHRDPRHARPEIRLTLDYDDDLRLMREVYAELGEDPAFGTSEIVELFARRPALASINDHLSEEYWERTRDLVELEFERDGRTYVITESSTVPGASASP